MKLILIAVMLLASNLSRATELLISTHQLGLIMGYPEARIVAREQKQMDPSFGKGIPLSAFNYDSKDNSFAIMDVVVAESGTLLGPDLKNYFENFVHQKPDISEGSVKRIDGKGKYEGYVGVCGFGAGGTGYRAVITIPSEQVDVLVDISLPNDTSLTVTPDIAAYNKAVVGEGKFVFDRLTDCVEYAANQILTKKFIVKKHGKTGSTPTSNNPQ